MIRIGVIGCGQWGRNYVRMLGDLGHAARVVEIGHRDRASLAGLRRRFPPVNAVLDPGQLIENPSVDGVVIATPATTHAGLATKALQAGKHVMVEEPLATALADAVRLHEWCSTTWTRSSRCGSSTRGSRSPAR